jgi:DNA polymerase-3 subunit beta
MNITVNTALLAKKLRMVEKIVQQKSILPIMANVLLRAEMGELKLSTTNLEISLTCACPITVNEPGAITAPVKPLLDLLAQITEDQTHLMLEKNRVRIASGAFKMRLATLPADDFPALPTMPDGGILLPGNLFKTMIKRVRYAISDSSKRYFMNGALLSLTDNAIALVTTDGKRLSLTATKRTTPGPSLEIVIPSKTLDVLANDEGHEDILFAKDMRQMFFVTDDNLLTSRTIDGNFPNYKRILPTDNKQIAKIPRTALLAALRRVALASGDSRALTFTLEEHMLSLSSADAQMGDATEHLPVEYAGPAFKFAFEWNFVEDFLNAAASPNVRLSLKDATTATLWSDGDGGEFMNVIMQMRP